MKHLYTLSHQSCVININRLQMSSPDKYQTEALVDIARLFGWSKFVIIADNSDYGAYFSNRKN